MFGEERSLEAMSHRESIAMLAATSVGRVVFTVAALPAIVPVTFALHGDAIVMRTSAGTRLALAADHGVLAFEADDVDAVTRTGWSVVVTGIAEVVTDPMQSAVIHGMVEPFAPGHNDVCVRLPLALVTGRRVAAGPACGLSAAAS